ncbi:Gfo/Idh/MocA family protein [Microbacterium murale]|uniref:1,5-anhydro-D-fructose reductase (1,5-anhydro-D-mannitol-forming) n=1 Tax=Microbacterium murale TaxID=1081040 RepID=A0ABU0P8F6_9MICO|nr:Gfo/Idh/MocA family oxidoreductase [Microbacterium murale]MDQ0643605.1 1,5-anhydro-D-fructose reductase (1,5-anhydro-D-mannitol-forming) [Microbacterium murale]
MTTAHPIKIAIASFAHMHAAGYARTLLGMPGVSLLASDPDGATAPDDAPRGADLAAQIGVPYVDDYDDLFAWGPDAVIVTTENARHRAIVERAAAEGVHVLCEKPIATEIADAEAMIAACAAAGVILMIAYPVRFASQFTALRQHLDAGALGEPFAIVGTNNGKIPTDSRQWFTDPALSGGGAMVDHVVHCADLIDALTGGMRARTVYAAANGILHSEKNVAAETGGLVTITYESGLIATIDCSWSQPDAASTWGGLTLKVTGTNGSVEIEPFAEHIGGVGVDGDIRIGYGADIDALLIDEFLEAVRRSGAAVPGRAPLAPQPDGAVGMRTLEIVDAARRSARAGSPVAV